MVVSALLFDLFMIKPLRWNSKLEFCISNLSPGLYCQYTLARIRGIVSSSESEMQSFDFSQIEIECDNQERMKSQSEKADLQASPATALQFYPQPSLQAQSPAEKKQFEACEQQIQLITSLKEQCLTNTQALP